MTPGPPKDKRVFLTILILSIPIGMIGYGVTTAVVRYRRMKRPLPSERTDWTALASDEADAPT